MVSVLAVSLGAVLHPSNARAGRRSRGRCRLAWAFGMRTPGRAAVLVVLVSTSPTRLGPGAGRGAARRHDARRATRRCMARTGSAGISRRTRMLVVRIAATPARLRASTVAWASLRQRARSHAAHGEEPANHRQRHGGYYTKLDQDPKSCMHHLFPFFRCPQYDERSDRILRRKGGIFPAAATYSFSPRRTS
jgi:hypothetical protein